MLINPNLYKGGIKVIEHPRDAIGHKYIGDISDFTPGKTYTFSCKIIQIPGKGKLKTNKVHIAQGNNQEYKTYGDYYIKDISSGILEFTFDYIAGVNSLLCYTAVGKDGYNMGAEWSDIEIVEGNTKNPIFVPNENNIETAKRQYFIGGGYFKEVYPIS